MEVPMQEQATLVEIAEQDAAEERARTASAGEPGAGTLRELETMLEEIALDLEDGVACHQICTPEQQEFGNARADGARRELHRTGDAETRRRTRVEGRR